MDEQLLGKAVRRGKRGKYSRRRNFLDKARPGDFCFIENVAPSAYEDKIEKIILYRWNRNYPGDLYFDIPLEEHGWKLIETDDFAGRSHEKITKEVYER